jgi:hypothetical protein
MTRCHEMVCSASYPARYAQAPSWWEYWALVVLSSGRYGAMKLVDLEAQAADNPAQLLPVAELALPRSTRTMAARLGFVSERMQKPEGETANVTGHLVVATHGRPRSRSDPKPPRAPFAPHRQVASTVEGPTPPKASNVQNAATKIGCSRLVRTPVCQTRSFAPAVER